MSDPESTPLAPPTQPGPIATPVARSSWATVIGTIAIVFGSLGSLQGVLGILSPLTTAFFRPFMFAGQAEAIEQSTVWNVGSGVAGLVIAVLLLVGGIRIVGRHRGAVVVLRGWAVAKILFILITTVVGYQLVQSQMEAFQNNPNLAGPGAPVFKTVGAIGMVFGVVFLCSLPVFVLIWFSRSKIKDEVAGWP